MGVDFSHYKMPTIKRRINHRMSQWGVKTIPEYVQILHQNNEEIELLHNDLLINQNQDWNTLHATVHKMIPSFSIVGISADFENMAKKVMEHAHVQLETHNILDFVNQIESVCLQACEELLEEMKQLKGNK